MSSTPLLSTELFWNLGSQPFRGVDRPHRIPEAVALARERGISYAEAKTAYFAENKSKFETRRPTPAVSRGATAQPRLDHRTASTCGKSRIPTPTKAIDPERAVAICNAARGGTIVAAASVDPYAPRSVLAADPEADALAKQIVALARENVPGASASPSEPLRASREPQTVDEAAGAIMAAWRGVGGASCP